MPSLPISGSPNIEILDFKTLFDLVNGKIFIDLSPSVWKAGGQDNVTAVRLKVTSPAGVDLKDGTANDFVPPMSNTAEILIPKVAGIYQWGVYAFEATLIETVDTVQSSYTIKKKFRLCAPNSKDIKCNTGKANYTMEPHCIAGFMTVSGGEGYSYATKAATSWTKNITFYYPTDTIPHIANISISPFDVLVYTGKNIVKGASIGLFDFDDNFSASVKFLGEASKDVRCNMNFCHLYCELARLMDILNEKCGTTEYAEAEKKLTQATKYVNMILLGIDCDKDVDAFITKLEKILGIDCACNDCIGQQINAGAVPPSRVVIEGCGVTEETFGTTVKFTINARTYNLILRTGDGDVALIREDVLDSCVSNLIIPIDSISSEIINEIINNTDILNLFSQIFNTEVIQTSICQALTELWNTLDPKCFASDEQWQHMDCKQKIQLLIDYVCAAGLEVCLPPTIITGDPFPDGYLDTPYSHTMYIGGTGPFVLSAITKPAWMTITLVDEHINFTGTPDALSENVIVNFTVNNCADANHFAVEQLIDILDPCVPVAFDGVPNMPTAVYGIPYSYVINLLGSGPFVFYNPDDSSPLVKPSWMNVNIVGNQIQFTGNPPSGHQPTQTVSFAISNCGGNISFEDSVSQTTCAGVTIASGLPIADAVAGEPYTATIGLSGTAPYSLSDIVKPAWMNINLDGSNVQITGTPGAAAEAVAVSFKVSNCSGTVIVAVDEEIDITGAGHTILLKNGFNDYGTCNTFAALTEVAEVTANGFTTNAGTNLVMANLIMKKRGTGAALTDYKFPTGITVILGMTDPGDSTKWLFVVSINTTADATFVIEEAVLIKLYVVANANDTDDVDILKSYDGGATKTAIVLDKTVRGWTAFGPNEVDDLIATFYGWTHEYLSIYLRKNGTLLPIQFGIYDTNSTAYCGLITIPTPLQNGVMSILGTNPDDSTPPNNPPSPGGGGGLGGCDTGVKIITLWVANVAGVPTTCGEETPPTCKVHSFAVFGSDDSQFTVTATLCDGTAYNSGLRYVGDGAHEDICARVGTVNVYSFGTGGIIITDSSVNC